MVGEARKKPEGRRLRGRTTGIEIYGAGVRVSEAVRSRWAEISPLQNARKVVVRATARKSRRRPQTESVSVRSEIGSDLLLPMSGKRGSAWSAKTRPAAGSAVAVVLPTIPPPPCKVLKNTRRRRRTAPYLRIRPYRSSRSVCARRSRGETLRVSP